jgi:hypothetical protein
VNAIVTSIVPPGLATADEEDEIPQIEVRVEMLESDLTLRSASVNLPSNATDVVLADALVDCLRGLATMRGPGLALAIERRVPVR